MVEGQSWRRGWGVATTVWFEAACKVDETAGGRKSGLNTVLNTQTYRENTTRESVTLWASVLVCPSLHLVCHLLIRTHFAVTHARLLFSHIEIVNSHGPSLPGQAVKDSLHRAERGCHWLVTIGWLSVNRFLL